MTVPQIKGPLRMIVLILFMVPLAGVASKSLAGDVGTLQDIGSSLIHGIPAGVAAAICWIFFRSPWAAEVQTAIHQQSTSTTTAPSGSVTVAKTETTITKQESTPTHE